MKQFQPVTDYRNHHHHHHHQQQWKSILWKQIPSTSFTLMLPKRREYVMDGSKMKEDVKRSRNVLWEKSDRYNPHEVTSQEVMFHPLLFHHLRICLRRTSKSLKMFSFSFSS